ncbi:STP1 protein [Plasmodium malariae]|uniref:STP1 protein n=1 Tax=Plasmodium malariae TaxID=5858 RepID=A0A1D3TDX4_PLAMA|nr:STP1 protein [Plasmodium malariae]SCP03051.1 STP1 protein [Plasmodium malariae]
MDSCFSSELSALGFGSFTFFGEPKFNRLRQLISDKTSSLSKVNDKKLFREKCFELADLLIKYKAPPAHYSQQKEKWEGAIRDWFRRYYKDLKNYGGCFIILDEEDKKILQLIYDAEDFCEEKESKKPNKKCLQEARDNSYNCDSKCSSEINQYNAWIVNKKSYFANEKEKIYQKCKKDDTLFSFPKRSCDVFKAQTFETILECKTSKLTTLKRPEQEKLSLSQDQTQDTKSNQIKSEKSTQHDVSQTSERSESTSGIQSHASADSLPKIQSLESATPETAEELSSKTDVSLISGDSESTDSKLPKPFTYSPNNEGSQETPYSQTKTLAPNTLVTDLQSRALLKLPKFSGQEQNLSVINTSSILITILLIMVFSIFIKYALTVMFKKKKKIKRKQMKFLRILLPSFSERKRIFLTNDQLVQQKYNNKEITKKIKIKEHNIKQNVNSSKRKTERTKTIIEVHMEVLQKFRNEEWDLKKREYLEICLEEFTEGQTRDYPNLESDQLLAECTKNSRGTKESITLCNKWIKRYKYLSEKLKKEDWFNSLKNEWKREREYIKRSNELNNNIPNDTPNISSLETEKDIWRQWISKKGRIIEQYLEYEWFSGLTEELQNTLDEYGNDRNKYNVSLIDLEELEQKGCSEELYKYVKKKLLEKLCILVLMTILEECKKEENTENSESYLDNSINECKLGKNIDEKSGITENINKDIGNVLEYMENKESYSNKGEEPFIQELNDWIREENTYIYFINN